MNDVQPSPAPARNLADVMGQVQGTLNCISLFTSDDTDSLVQLKEQMSAARKDLLRAVEENPRSSEVAKARNLLSKVGRVEELVQRTIDGDKKALEEAENISLTEDSISSASKKSVHEEGRQSRAADTLARKATVEVESPRKASRAKDIAPQSQLQRRELFLQQSHDTLPKEPLKGSVATAAPIVTPTLTR